MRRLAARQFPHRAIAYNKGMTPEMFSIVGVGIALAGLILNSQRQLRAEMISRMDKLGADFNDLRREVSGLDARLSRLEGVISTALFNRPSLVESAERGD